MTGWIKLHRQLTKWEWYDDANTFRLFMHLLLKANHKTNNWRGITIQSGQLATGRITLAQELNLTEQQIRTSLNKLKSTNEITIKPTNKYSIITINNWHCYQQDNQQKPSNEPTNNQQITTNNNDNNENNEKKILLDPMICAEIDEILSFYKQVKENYRASFIIRSKIMKVVNNEGGYDKEYWQQIFKKCIGAYWLKDGEKVYPSLDNILDNHHKIINNEYQLIQESEDFTNGKSYTL